MNFIPLKANHILANRLNREEYSSLLIQNEIGNMKKLIRSWDELDDMTKYKLITNYYVIKCDLSDIYDLINMYNETNYSKVIDVPTKMEVEDFECEGHGKYFRYYTVHNRVHYICAIEDKKHLERRKVYSREELIDLINKKEIFPIKNFLETLYQSAEDKENYLREIFETVYLNDVIERNNLHNALGMHELVRILASSMGSSTNVRRITNTFKSVGGVDISPNTISRYLEHLQDAFIINESLRYNVKGRKYIGTETKYYFEDVGIRNAIVGFRQIEFNHTMENIIYNELRRLGYSVDVGLVEHSVRNEEGKIERRNLEIDFVVNRHDERLYIQSAYSLHDEQKIEQEQASLLNVSDGFKKVVIVGDRYSSNYNDNGVLMLGVYDFLLNPESVKR